MSEKLTINQTKLKIGSYKNYDDIDQSRIHYNQNTDVLTRIKNTVELIKRIYGYKESSIIETKRKLYFK